MNYFLTLWSEKNTHTKCETVCGNATGTPGWTLFAFPNAQRYVYSPAQVPLQGAAIEGDLTMVTTLLKAGAASSGERERDGQTPLHAAAEGGRYGEDSVFV